MGIRLSLKKELMASSAANLLTADEIRQGFTKALREQPEMSRTNFGLMSRFNENHTQLLYNPRRHALELSAQKHRLFNELLYDKNELISWVHKHNGVITLD